VPDAGGSPFCTGCGRRYEDGWSFCPACGAARVVLDGGEAPAETAPASIGSVRAADLVAANEFMQAKAALDEAIALDAGDHRLRLQRARLLARLGLYPAALADLREARRLLPRGEVQVLLEIQELERLVRDRSRSTFVRRSELPRIPRWLSRVAGVRRDSSAIG